MSIEFLSKYYMFFVNGIKNTIILSIFTLILGVLFGVILAFMRLSKNKPVKLLSGMYVEFVRGTPLLVQLFLIYYGLKFPDIPLLGEQGSLFAAGIITLSINSTAYVAEIVRSGIQSVDKGQVEAARALGLSHSITMTNIILPQALKNILPALGNEFITVVKESSIVSIIGVHDLMFNAEIVVGASYKPFQPYIVAAIMYFIITFSISKLIKSLERKMSVSDRN